MYDMLLGGESLPNTSHEDRPARLQQAGEDAPRRRRRNYSRLRKQMSKVQAVPARALVLATGSRHDCAFR